MLISMLTGGSLTKILDFRKVPKTEGFRYPIRGGQQAIGNIPSEQLLTRAKWRVLGQSPQNPNQLKPIKFPPSHNGRPKPRKNAGDLHGASDGEPAPQAAPLPAGNDSAADHGDSTRNPWTR